MNDLLITKPMTQYLFTKIKVLSKHKAKRLNTLLDHQNRVLFNPNLKKKIEKQKYCIIVPIKGSLLGGPKPTGYINAGLTITFLTIT